MYMTGGAAEFASSAFGGFMAQIIVRIIFVFFSPISLIAAIIQGIILYFFWKNGFPIQSVIITTLVLDIIFFLGSFADIVSLIITGLLLIGDIIGMVLFFKNVL